MAFEDSDRRRTMLLALATLLALPILWFASRTEDASEPDVEPTQAPSAEQLGTDVAYNTVSNRPPLEAPDDDPIFMAGPASELNPGVPAIAVPERPETAPIQLDASFRSTVAGVRSCLVSDLPSGLSITVTNLDNGRAVTCVTSLAPFNQIEGIVLHTDTFSLLADLTEAPIPVEVVQ